MQSEEALRNELESSKKDLKVLKAFAKKGQAQIKLLHDVVNTVFQTTFPNKWKISKEGITEDIVYDFKTAYAAHTQDIQSVQSDSLSAQSAEIQALQLELNSFMQKNEILESLVGERDNEIVQIRNELERQTCELNILLKNNKGLGLTGLAQTPLRTATAQSGQKIHMHFEDETKYASEDDDDDDPFAVLTMIAPLSGRSALLPTPSSSSSTDCSTIATTATTTTAVNNSGSVSFADCFSCSQHLVHVQLLEEKNRDLAGKIDDLTRQLEVSEETRVEEARRKEQVFLLARQEEVNSLEQRVADLNEQIVSMTSSALTKEKDFEAEMEATLARVRAASTQQEEQLLHSEHQQKLLLEKEEEMCEVIAGHACRLGELQQEAIDSTTLYETRISHLNNELKECEDRIVEMEISHAEMITTKQNCIIDLEVTLAEMKGIVHEIISKHEASVMSMQESITSKQERIADLEVNVSELKSSIIKLTSTGAEEHVRERTVQSNGEMSPGVSVIAELEESMAAVSASSASKQLRIDELLKSLEDAEESCVRAAEEREQVVGERDDLLASLAGLQVKLNAASDATELTKIEARDAVVVSENRVAAVIQEKEELMCSLTALLEERQHHIDELMSTAESVKTQMEEVKVAASESTAAYEARIDELRISLQESTDASRSQGEKLAQMLTERDGLLARVASADLAQVEASTALEQAVAVAVAGRDEHFTSILLEKEELMRSVTATMEELRGKVSSLLNEIKTCGDVSASKQAHIDELLKSLEDADLRIESQAEELQRAVGARGDLMTSVAGLQTQLSAASEAAVACEKSRQEATSAMEEATVVIQEKEELIASLTGNIDELNSNVAQMQTEMEELKTAASKSSATQQAHINELLKKMDDAVEREVQVGKLQSALECEKVSLTEAKKDLEAAVASSIAMQARIDELTSGLDSAEEMCKNRAKECERIQHECDDLLSASSDLRDKLDVASEAAAASELCRQEDCTALKRSTAVIQEKEELIDALTASVAERDCQLSDLQSRVACLQVELDESKREASAAVTCHHTRITDLERLLEDAEMNCRSQVDEHHRVKTECSNLSASVAALETKLQIVAEAAEVCRQEAHKATAAMQEKEEFMCSLSSTVESVKAQMDEVKVAASESTAAYEARIDELLVSLQEATDTSRSQGEEIDRVLAERDGLLARVASADLARVEASTALEQAVAVAVAGRDEHFAAILLEKEELVRSVTATMEEQRLQIEDLLVRVQEDAEKSTNASSEALGAQKLRIEELETVVFTLEKQVEALTVSRPIGLFSGADEKHVDELKNRVEELSAAREVSDLTLLEKQLSVETLERTISKLERIVTDLTTDNDNKQSIIKELESKLDYLNSSLSDDMLGLFSGPNTPIKEFASNLLDIFNNEEDGREGGEDEDKDNNKYQDSDDADCDSPIIGCDDLSSFQVKILEEVPLTPSAPPRSSSSVSNSNPWILYEEQHIIPPYGIDSAVVAHLLCNWTADTNKIRYFMTWAHALGKTELPLTFPMGLRLTELSPVVRDGFLMLVAPILANMSRRPITVFVRQSPNKNKDRSFSISSDVYGPQHASASSLADDDEWHDDVDEVVVYDIRFKIDEEHEASYCTSPVILQLHPALHHQTATACTLSSEASEDNRSSIEQDGRGITTADRDQTDNVENHYGIVVGGGGEIYKPNDDGGDSSHATIVDNHHQQERIHTTNEAGVTPTTKSDLIQERLERLRGEKKM